MRCRDRGWSCRCVSLSVFRWWSNLLLHLYCLYSFYCLFSFYCHDVFSMKTVCRMRNRCRSFQYCSCRMNEVWNVWRSWYVGERNCLSMIVSGAACPFNHCCSSESNYSGKRNFNYRNKKSKSVFVLPVCLINAVIAWVIRLNVNALCEMLQFRDRYCS